MSKKDYKHSKYDAGTIGGIFQQGGRYSHLIQKEGFLSDTEVGYGTGHTPQEARNNAKKDKRKRGY
jgi:hypothetical protein